MTSTPQSLRSIVRIDQALAGHPGISPALLTRRILDAANAEGFTLPTDWSRLHAIAGPRRLVIFEKTDHGLERRCDIEWRTLTNHKPSNQRKATQ